MALGKAIYKILSDDSTVSGYVSTRIYPLRINQNDALPAITYEVLNSVPSDTKGGTTGKSKLDVLRLEILSYSTTYIEVQNIKAGIRSVLDRYSGTPSGTGVKIDSIQYADEEDDYDNNKNAYVHSTQFFIRVDNG